MSGENCQRSWRGASYLGGSVVSVMFLDVVILFPNYLLSEKSNIQKEEILFPFAMRFISAVNKGPSRNSVFHFNNFGNIYFENKTEVGLQNHPFLSLLLHLTPLTNQCWFWVVFVSYKKWRWL